MTMIQWNPQNLAIDALRDCGDLLNQRKIRHAVRAAHDAMHCSLVELWSIEGWKEGQPYTMKDRLVTHIKERQEKQGFDQALEFDEKETKKWFSVLNTRKLLDLTKNKQSLSSSIHNEQGAETLVDIRDSIEHPKPGETAWDVSTCLEAIEAGANLAEWAMRELNCDVSQLADRIRSASQAILER
ncbi:hypothetical protein [Pannonibacter sp. SL95]|uniref:hypothetical protein n=1 Tax=Pannonibacter sp. SL95 TaxID=2995153 RepID=UPI002275D8E3|nr:hypothetical protein [Pannonibacter sp. SL95]MCY1708475.1 hypothetical protein [Pannonibacter sp. SL95]